MQENFKTDLKLNKSICFKENNDSEETEMEVRVDPMSVLQCCLEDSEPENDPDVNEPNQTNSEQEDLEEDDDEESDDETMHNSPSGSSESENSENTCIIYLCSICKRNFTTNKALQEHVYTHSASYTKTILTYSFNNKFHTLPALFISSTNIGTHKDETTEDGNNTETQDEGVVYKCPICAKDILSKGALKVHLETHRPKGQYGCDICGRV